MFEEYVRQGRFIVKIDVYSFGIVSLLRGVFVIKKVLNFKNFFKGINFQIY